MCVLVGQYASMGNDKYWRWERHTLEYRKVGPGVTYVRMNFPEYPLKVYTMTIDLKNQYNSIETFQGNDHAGSTEL
ncbi:MAG: hypothetical protein ACLRRG_04375 [Barnesiella sp.]